MADTAKCRATTYLTVRLVTGDAGSVFVSKTAKYNVSMR